MARTELQQMQSMINAIAEQRDWALNVTARKQIREDDQAAEIEELKTKLEEAEKKPARKPRKKKDV